MGCGNCGSGASGAAPGCKGNGGCSTGGCNRLNVYDWLSTLPLQDAAKPYPLVEFSFNKGSRKEFFKNNTHHVLEKGMWFALEGLGGYDIGQVSLTGELVKLQLKKYGVRENDVVKRVLHPATEEELNLATEQKEREADILIRSRAISRSLKLDMKLCEVEIQADGKKGTFFYTADQRVDFRELIRVYATDFKMKVEMKQIGARQESGKVGGIGSCGRELCCSTWLSDFKSVNTTAARYQNLSINQTKLSGQCGRLKCCLNFELDTYMDALVDFPDHAEHLETVKGVVHLQKRDIFKNLMWYSYSDNNKQYPLSITRVKEIQKMNKLGQKADDLMPVELETRESKSGKVAEMGYVNDVGSITLKALENKNKKKKHSGNKGGNPQGNRPSGGEQQASGQPPREENRPNRGPQNKGNNRPQQPGGQPQPNKAAQPSGEPGQQQPRQNQNRPQQQGPRPPKQAGNQPKPEGQPGQQAKPQQNQGPRPEGGQPRENRGPRPEGAQPRESRGPRPEGGQPRENRGPRPEGGQPRENKGPRPEGNNQPRENRGPRPQRNRPPRPEGGGGNPAPTGGDTPS